MKDFELYKKQFREKALNNSFSEDIIQKCLNYSENLFSKNLPIIYNSYHLAGLVGYEHSYLTRAIISTDFFYRKFNIVKKNGLLREISEPLPSLKEIQYFILKEILYKQKVSRFCKSYIPKRKFREYLKYHSNEKQVLTLDIENFFPSIKYKHINNYFTELGYAEDVSSFLASLCTYSISKKKKEKVELNERFLPQGAPTSPYLSNLILMKFDDTIANYCKEKSIKYTRYADDMAFSGSDFDKEILIKLVQSELNKVDLKLNKSKINFMKQNVPQVISGVLVNKKIQLPKEIRNEIRNTMYFITKYGYEDHIKRTNETRDYYLLHLLGRIQYALNLNPNDSELIKYKSVLLEYKKKYYN
ncbi:reverse transcriptase family protein [Elizabethkingia miricola]|uniref:reverse transcriptase family protein n=3 Tax=Elizabethkingia miricola TaxID=172045 RepID=UPI000C15BE9B|nr:reverse transcriptase family protein [Elizabethkingia miricola]PSL89520.1 RNA-directed DNA polymerase [Elizabethkingia miricola]QHQ87506.1 RNA-directed DNA polymerase [Elizabethkingia miricola]UIO94958.1 reverse transcriptase family protein [Elizabethkingia miricola]WER11797.1 reverse transcriptase family protein [Elizabethkingia miricola]WGL71972.1 reverse transcriptase family protein [Elizabethkingia miricola]